MAANGRDKLAQMAYSVPPPTRVTPAFPKIPDEIKNANPKLTEAYARWEREIAEWIKKTQAL